MKHTLLVLLLFAAITVKGQNAYYDSKYIIDWLHHPSLDKKEEGERQLKVYNKLKAYIDPDNATDSDYYFMVDAVYAEFFRRNEADITLDRYIDIFDAKNAFEFINSNKKDAPIFQKITKMIDRRKKHKDAIPQYVKAIARLELVINDSTLKFPRIKNAGGEHIDIEGVYIPVSVSGGDDAGTIHFFGRTTFSQEMLERINLDTTIASIVALRDSLLKSVDFMNRKKQEYDVNAKLYFMKLTPKAKKEVISEIFKKNVKEDNFFIQLAARSVEEGQKQAEIRIIAQQNQPTVQLANFKMPSQGEIVDALAIYVAKRFKQEAIMYMIDQLKENMVADTLFTIMFPETRKLLFNQNAFSIPRFGTEWKYAISKDYTLMPDHMLCSSYIGARFDKQSFDCMHDALLLAKMVEKKYSYVEIMRNYGTNESTEIKSSVMKTFTKWSYILNEELFTTFGAEVLGRKVSDSLRMLAAGTSTGDYWIAPSIFNKEVTPEQMSLMLAMLKQRHGDLDGQLGIDLGDSLHKQMPRLLAIKKWMSKNLLVLNQFQKNQERLFKTELKDEDKGFFNGVSYWTFMDDILHSFIDTTVMRHITDADLKQLEYVSDVNEIYGSYQTKNYPAAVSQLLGIIEHLCGENTNYMLSQDIKVNYKAGTLFKVKDKNKIADAMGIYNTYFSESTQAEDLAEFQYPLQRNLNKMRSAVHSQRIPENVKAFELLEQKLNKFHWSDVKENEELKKELVVFRAKPYNRKMQHNIDSVAYIVDSSLFIMAKRYDARLCGFGGSYCRSLNKAKSYASLLTDIMNSGTNSQNLSKVIEAHAAPVTSYKLKRYNRRTLDIGAYLGAYVGAESLPQGNVPAKAVYGLTVPIGFNYTWATLKPLNVKRVKYPFARKNDKVREFSGVSHTIGLSIIDIAAPVAYRLTNGSDGALPKDLKWSQMLSPGLHYRYGFKNTPICISTGVQYTPQLRTMAGNNQVSAVRTYVGVLFDMPLLFIKK